jgi:hypothetical protein
MAAQEVSVAKLGSWIARALAESATFAVDLDTEGLGFQMPEAVANDPAVKAAGKALSEAGNALRSGADSLDAAVLTGDGGKLTQAFAKLFEGLYRYVDSADAIVDRVKAKAATLPAPQAAATLNFATSMPRKLIDLFVALPLEEQLPRLNYLLALLGIVERRVIEASGAVGEPRFVRTAIRLDRLKTLFQDPAGHFGAVYGWGTPSFDPLRAMQALLTFHGPESSAHVGLDGPNAYLRTGPFLWKRDATANPPGLMLDLSSSITKAFKERVELSPTWGMTFETNVTAAGGLVFRLRPPFDVTAQPKTGTAGGAVSFVVDRNGTAQAVTTIIGGNPLLNVTAASMGVGAELAIGAGTAGPVTIDPGVVGNLKQLTITLGTKDADSFLGALLAAVDIKGVFDLGVGWKLKGGLVVRAAGGLEIAIPMHQSLGAATFDTLYLVLKINPDGSFSLETSAGITGKIGPLTAVVDRVGAVAKLDFSSGSDKNLGPVGLSLGFKMPNGVGLSVDAGILTGGGYLFIDPDKGDYAGALELVFSGFLALKAIGIISTRMPDGSKGFSLLVIITAEFGVPVQLGFGFTLIGVGGLLGLNRTMKLEELAEGVRSGAVESVMFPRDVVANAPKIISDLQRFFPAQPDTFLIGPMAKLGWGTPTLISASLGVIIEVPPGNIAILGVLKCALPDEDAALLVLQVKFIGALEVDKSRMWFFASLYGSRVLFITLDGDLGLLISWGDQPEFILSVGGFHPKFNPPPMPFPTPQRLSLSILNESFARIRVSAYFAVTSNTAQFGAAVELFFGVSAFSLEGHLGFDALFQFSPFYFVITISASVSVKVFGAGVFSVHIHGELEGTSPWHIEGEGSISVLFWDLDIPISATWGDKTDTVLPDIAALPIIAAEFQKRENWVALAPNGTRLSVSLRKIDAATELVLHPLAVLRVSQRAVPLELAIQKIGNQTIGDIALARITVTSPGLVQKSPVREPFATAQFRDMDAAAKLSAPGYEPQIAGADVSVAGSDTRTTHAVKRIVLHELITIDSNYKEHLRRFFNVGRAWFTQLLGSNAIARSALSEATKATTVPFDTKVTAAAPGFVVADAATNSAWAGAGVFTSHAAATDALARLGADPATAGQFHVIPAAETVAA